MRLIQLNYHGYYLKFTQISDLPILPLDIGLCLRSAVRPKGPKTEARRAEAGGHIRQLLQNFGSKHVHGGPKGLRAPVSGLKTEARRAKAAMGEGIRQQQNLHQRYFRLFDKNNGHERNGSASGRRCSCIYTQPLSSAVRASYTPNSALTHAHV